MSNSNGLPKGWIGTTVASIAKSIQYGHTASATDEPNGPRFLRITDIQNNYVDWNSVPSCSISAEDINKYRLQTGDIVFARTGATTGKSYLIRECPEAVFASYLIRLRMHDDVFPQYVQAFFQTNDYWRQIEGGKRGIGQPNVNASVLGTISLPLAPLNQQRRIVAKIEELFSDLDAGVAVLERVKANLKRYRAAVLKAAVEGKLTEAWRTKNPPKQTANQLLQRILKDRRIKWEEAQLVAYAKSGKSPPNNWKDKYKEPATPDTSNLPELPKGWCWATLEQINLAERPMSYGVLQPGPDLSDGIPLVRVCDVIFGRVLVDQLKRISPEISDNYRRTILQGGEVLLTIVGTIGRSAVAPTCLKGANTARAVAVIPLSPSIPANYVVFVLNENAMRSRLTLAAHEVARKTLNLEDVRITCIPIPPNEEQEQIANEVGQRFSIIEEAETQIEANLKRAARLRQSILKRAFEGKLVPQDPRDEPATVLLGKIKASTNNGNSKNPIKSSRKK